MHAAVTETLRQRPILKSVSTVVLVTFLSLTLQPLAVAAQLPKAKPLPATSQTNAPAEGADLARTLENIEANLSRLETKLRNRKAADTERASLKTLRETLDAQDRTTRADFDAVGQRLREKNLPPVIQNRHAQAVAQYQKEMTALRGNLDAIEQAADDSTRHTRTGEALRQLKAKQKKVPKQKFDPKDLPTKALLPNRKNAPKTKPQDFQRAGLESNLSIQVAALGDFTFDKLPGASDPAYLAASPEVTLTVAVKNKAQALNYNPVEIHNWIRNNVEWLPTWGATQDADVTLGSQRGNAMDIASLEIALLRASGIPARYVYGTIEIPADKFKNWVGGFTDTNAALDYASSGGIPVVGIVSNGQIAKVQLEHVWVEAAIDFQPSRGAVNKAADAWIPLDASYKQYQDLPGLDVVAISGLDPNALAQSFATSGTVNDAEGWVQNLNSAVLTNAQTQAQTALTSHIQNNMTNPTVGDVIGGRKIVTATSTVLPASLPYRSMVTGNRYGALPSGLQNAMTFAFGVDIMGDPVNAVTYPWARLNNHKVTLSFKPATAADEQALASLLPPGPITDPSQLPSSIPAYLIHVIPEIALDGQTVAQGGAMTLGTDLNFFYGIRRVNANQSQNYTYNVTAGSYLSVGVAGGSVSPQKLIDLKAKLTQTQTTLQSGDATLIGALGREDILGDMFYVGALAYFGEYIAFSRAAAQPQKARHHLPVGYGTFGYEPNVHLLFGIPSSISLGTIAVNVRIGYVIQSLDGDPAKRVPLGLQTGLLSSALEHAVPEQMFSAPTLPAFGVSAVKALQVAANQGQRIYHVTPQNQTSVLPNLHLDQFAMEEITQALATGKEVIAHTDRITVDDWTGEGYVLFDPVSGGGSYKITGGSNGQILKKISSTLLKTGFWTGVLASVVKKHPEYFKLLVGPIGYLIAAAINFWTVSEDCASAEMVYMYAGIMLAYNAIVFGLSVLLAGTVLGLALASWIMWAVVALEFIFENWLRTQVLESPICRK